MLVDVPRLIAVYYYPGACYRMFSSGRANIAP